MLGLLYLCVAIACAPLFILHLTRSVLLTKSRDPAKRKGLGISVTTMAAIGIMGVLIFVYRSDPRLPVVNAIVGITWFIQGMTDFEKAIRRKHWMLVMMKAFNIIASLLALLSHLEKSPSFTVLSLGAAWILYLAAAYLRVVYALAKPEAPYYA